MDTGFLYLATSVLCSVSVSVVLKYARHRGVDIRQAIAANYLAAILLCWFLLKPSLAVLHAPGTPWGILLLLGVLLPTVFIAMFNAVRFAGIVRSDAAQRLSLFIPLLAAFFLFGETFTSGKVFAIGVGLLALVCLLRRSESAGAERAGERATGSGGQTHAMPLAGTTSAGHRVWVWPLAVWLGYGVCDILFKQVARTGTAFASGLLVAFALALLLMVIYLLAKRVTWRLSHLAVGLGLGALNFANIYTYIRAHQSLPNDPAIVFSAMNIGVISLSAVAGVVLFHERLSKINALGLVLAVAAVVLLTPW